MKTNKSYKEAILRAYPSEKENTQDQEHLLNMRKQENSKDTQEQTPVIETHKNIMRSWLNLRNLDQRLADKDKT